MLATPKRMFVPLGGMRFADALAHQRLHQVAAAHRDGGFVHHHAEPRVVHGRADAARGGFQVAKVGVAVGQRRRSHGDENHVAVAGRRGQIGGEFDAAALGRQREQFLQKRLVNG